MPLLGVYPRETEINVHLNGSRENAHSSFIHQSQQLETAQVFASESPQKQAETSTTVINILLSENSQMQKRILCLIYDL